MFSTRQRPELAAVSGSKAETYYKLASGVESRDSRSPSRDVDLEDDEEHRPAARNSGNQRFKTQRGTRVGSESNSSGVMNRDMQSSEQRPSPSNITHILERM